MLLQAGAPGVCTKGDKEILEKVQRRAVAMVSNFKAKDYENKLVEAGMITLEQRRERGDLIIMYRIMTGKDDVPHTTWFKMMSDRDNTGVQTRTDTGTLNVLPPSQAQNEIRKHFFSQRVVEKWNKLPDLVKQADRVNTFKNRLDDVMFPRARWSHNTRQVTAEQNNLVTPE